MLWAVICIPAVAAVLAMAIRAKRLGRAVLLAGALGHSGSVAWLCAKGVAADGNAWLGLDAAGKLFLCITSGLFLATAFYAVGYLKRESGHPVQDSEEGFLFRNERESTFIGCLLLFLATMSLVCLSRHLGLLWVAVEATTLVSAPLIMFHRHHRSLEATWKYLLICSVGIALALLGNFFLAYAARHQSDRLGLQALLDGAATMDPVWLKAAFVMLLVGYGTKMGLAPMHTWLPDAHSESPSMVSALLSGALLNCAFLGLMRGMSVLAAAGLERFAGELLVLLGLASMAIAAVFLIRQNDFKRMLAYSSIEHMGILALGVGLGGLAADGAMLHALGHSMTKGLLFLAAGNLLALHQTKKADEIRGVLRTTPMTGALWLAGFLALAGSPPFGVFLSELTVLKGALDAGRWGVAGGYLLALAVVFVAMARTILPMAFGSPSAEMPRADRREPLWTVVPPLVLGGVVLILGVYVPSALWNVLHEAASLMGGR